MWRPIEQRNSERAERNAASLIKARAELAEIASRLGGRFLLIGSAARGTMRADSDVDVLVDVPDACLAEAWSAAEDVLMRHGFVPDVRPLSMTSEAFRARALPEAVAP